MKLKLYFLLIVVLLWFKASFAQRKSAGLNNFSIGYGLGTWSGSVIILGENQPDNVGALLGPIYLKYDRVLSDRISLGFNFAYVNYQIKKRPGYFTYTYIDEYSVYNLLLRMNISIGKSHQFDPYFGFGFGYGNGELTDSAGNPDPHHDYTIADLLMVLETTIGARVYFTNKFGMYAEFGVSRSLLQMGVTYRF